MKKIVLILTSVLLILCIFSCGDRTSEGDASETVDYYESACEQLDKSSMGGTEYSDAQIDEFEKRFTKMNLEGGFTKVTHYRSTSEYAYVIEFENSADAKAFAERVASPKYNVKAYETVVVYGESDRIDALK